MPNIIPVEKSNYHQLAQFLSGFSDGLYSQETWLYKMHIWWDQNPAFSETTPRGWIMKDQTSIVGFFGDSPSFFHYEQQTITVANGTLWYVLPEYRSHSVPLFMHLLNHAKETFVFETTPRELVRALLPRFGFRSLPRSYTKLNSFLVLNATAVAKAFFANSFLKPVAPLFALVLETLQKIKGVPKSIEARTVISEFSHADQRFDALWQRTKNRYAATNVRSADVLNWYLIDTTQQKHLFAYEEAGEICGYAILGIGKRRGLNVGECLDLWYENPKTLPHLFSSLYQFSKTKHLDLLMFTHFSKEIEAACSNMFTYSLDPDREYLRVPEKFRDDFLEKDHFFSSLQGDYFQG